MSRDISLLPCPFCGGEAEIIHIEQGENAGGSCVCCTGCYASSNVEFEFKENFVSNWNKRVATLSAEVAQLREGFKKIEAAGLGGYLTPELVADITRAALSQPAPTDAAMQRGR